MARSSYIYTVLDTKEGDDPLKAAFTVRHELVTWIGKRIDVGAPIGSLRIVRVPDGDPYYRTSARDYIPALEYWKKHK